MTSYKYCLLLFINIIKGVFSHYFFFLQEGKRIRRIQHHCHLRDQKNNYNVILHVINYINLGLFTILDVSINQDSPIAPLEVDRQGPELCSSSFGLIQTQSCTLCPYQFLYLSNSRWMPCSNNALTIVCS